MNRNQLIAKARKILALTTKKTHWVTAYSVGMYHRLSWDQKKDYEPYLHEGRTIYSHREITEDSNVTVFSIVGE